MDSMVGIAPPLTTLPECPPSTPDVPAASALLYSDGPTDVTEWTAAKVLVEHLFAQGNAKIAGVEYAVGYRLASGPTGGDIVDVYRFDNDSVSFSIADISGKGPEAAVHAALVKYGLRSYASAGLAPEAVLRSLDRLYLENCAFNKVESFASVFFGVVDASRRILHYASGGHEAVAVVLPGRIVKVLPPTAPLVGVFDDQHHLFKHAFIELPPGAVFVATTDGITEARSPDGAFFGMEGFLEVITEYFDDSPDLIAQALITRVTEYTQGRLRDDIAVVAARFL